MEASEPGASDGQVRQDDAWEWRLQRLMDSTPLAATALEALRPLADFADFSIEWDMLKTVLQKQERRWRNQGFLGKLGLPSGFMRFALAIFGYTLDDPMIYSVINRVMFDPARGMKGAAPGKDLSPGLRACAPYIKLLDEALAQLPSAFVFRGRVQRGVKWVYPRPDAHDPALHFALGAVLTWYVFNCSSRKADVMSQPQVGRSPLYSPPPPPSPTTTTTINTQPCRSLCGRCYTGLGVEVYVRLQFCGHEAGPRTIFTIDATRAYDISAFSFYGEEEAEVRR
jgi:hypothetical protein